MGMSQREESLRSVEGSSSGDWWQDLHVIRITLVGEREEAPPDTLGSDTTETARWPASKLQAVTYNIHVCHLEEHELEG